MPHTILVARYSSLELLFEALPSRRARLLLAHGGFIRADVRQLALTAPRLAQARSRAACYGLDLTEAELPEGLPVELHARVPEPAA
jgi:hypothetical protein